MNQIKRLPPGPHGEPKVLTRPSWAATRAAATAAVTRSQARRALKASPTALGPARKQRPPIPGR